jgi:hypothetical protein
MSYLTDAHSVTLKFTLAQHEWLATTANALAEISGHPVSQSELIMRLIELGAPQLIQTITPQNSPKTSRHLRVISSDT